MPEYKLTYSHPYIYEYDNGKKLGVGFGIPRTHLFDATNDTNAEEVVRAFLATDYVVLNERTLTREFISLTRNIPIQDLVHFGVGPRDSDPPPLISKSTKETTE